MKVGDNPNTRLSNIVIVGVLTLQLIPFVFKGWVFPFIAYPMYSYSNPPGPCNVAHSKVILHTRTGNKIHFLPQAGQELSRSVSVFGLSQTTYQRLYVYPMISDRHGEQANAAALELGRRMNREAEDPVVKIELQVEFFRLNNGQIEMTEDFSDFYDVQDTVPENE